MPKKELWIDILIAIASVIIGIIVSPIFEVLITPLFGSETRASLVAVLVLGLIIVSGIAAIGVYIRKVETRDESFARSIQDIKNKLSLSAELIVDLPRTEGIGEVYRRVSEIYSRAEKEIWILWRRNPFAQQSEEEIRSEEWKGQRDNYYTTLFRKLNEQRDKTFFYRRILQIPNPSRAADGILDSTALTQEMAKHCKELLEYVRQNPENAILKQAPIFLPETVALVDDRYILWEIDAIDPDTRADYVSAVLIFDDVDGRFVQYLKNLLVKIDAHSHIVREIV
ncbi:MAG: hypothetical protein BWY63_01782 [Chloroflexi bacterium ADurb.Bin360]|nr:MAG: hypothetical protein BWY63_01782 [Chloroflexi bacterium ADurb.Bin360]